MSTAPEGWQNPKVAWEPTDPIACSDLERIENNINRIEMANRSLDQGLAPTGRKGTLRQILSWIANRLKAIMGTANWYDSPPTSLTMAKTHIDAAAPHSGHASTEALSAHTGASAPHSGHATTTVLNSHTSNKQNPHAVTASQVGAETPTGAQAKVNVHANRKDNPHAVTKTQVGLGSVDNVKQLPLAGGTMTGILTAQSNTSYATRQVRNVIISPNAANDSAMQNGDIWIQYK